jgi:DNA polymerase (family 10)
MITTTQPRRILNNAEIADRLANLAQLMSTQKENVYKVAAYQRAAKRIRMLAESIDELVRDDVDLTRYPGIGEGIASAIRELVRTGTLGKLEELRSSMPAAVVGITEYPRLDVKQVTRIYEKLGIASITELRQQLESGALQKTLGAPTAQHIEQGLNNSPAMLLDKAGELHDSVREYLLGPCGVRRAEVAGDYRRRVGVVPDLVFVIETDDFPSVVAKLQRFGGRTLLLASGENSAQFSLPSGVSLHLERSTPLQWGLALVAATGSISHLRKLAKVAGGLRALKAQGPFRTEEAIYRQFELQYIQPELREGRDELTRAAEGALPVLVTAKDLRGELHAHSTSSDGTASIETMAAAAQARGYEYIGITDHSQSLKIAGGLSVADLWKQIRSIDALNRRLRGIQVLKSAEVDILADGSLDYPDDLLSELDYTICSIHSRFDLDEKLQTERILRAMDNRFFNILGHATGRRLLKRPGYKIDIARLIRHASQIGCFFEINSSPERLDLSAENARSAAEAGVRLAITTDSHSTSDYQLVRYGIDQARRAGLAKANVLNCLPWNQLRKLFRR